MMPTTTGLPPNDSPTVTIGGRTYIIEFNLLAEKKLSQAGLTFTDAFRAIGLIGKAQSTLSHAIFEILAATTAHNFMQSNDSILSGDQWAWNLEPHLKAQPALMEKIGQALKVAFVKRWPELMQTAETAPANPQTATAPVQ